MNFFLFDIMFAIVPIMVFCVFAFVLIAMFSPKARAWLMGRGIKANKYVMEEYKDDIKDIADIGAESTEDAIIKTTSAVSKGFFSHAPGNRESGEGINPEAGVSGYMFCRHCGAQIEQDSVFCKSCGKRQ